MNECNCFPRSQLSSAVSIWFLLPIKKKIMLHLVHSLQGNFPFWRQFSFLRKKLVYVTIIILLWIGPGVLACATCGGVRSEAGHCFHLLFSSSSSFFFFLFLLFLRLLLFTDFGDTPEGENFPPPHMFA